MPLAVPDIESAINELLAAAQIEREYLAARLADVEALIARLHTRPLPAVKPPRPRATPKSDTEVKPEPPVYPETRPRFDGIDAAPINLRVTARATDATNP